MWKQNSGKPVETPQFDEQMAIDLGAKFLGEVVILGMAASILGMGFALKRSNDIKRKEEKQTKFENQIRFQTLVMDNFDAHRQLMQAGVEKLEKVDRGIKEMRKGKF